jgi:hypothetical protein
MARLRTTLVRLAWTTIPLLIAALEVEGRRWL